MIFAKSVQANLHNPHTEMDFLPQGNLWPDIMPHIDEKGYLHEANEISPVLTNIELNVYTKDTPYAW